jgi:hypothetical protein
MFIEVIMIGLARTGERTAGATRRRPDPEKPSTPVCPGAVLTQCGWHDVPPGKCESRRHH